MTDKEKLIKIKKLADAMYYAAQYLTTDASRLHKAMDEYHNFTIHGCKEEPIPWLTPNQARRAVEIEKEEMINKFCEWVKKNITYTHPRKGTEECAINLGRLKDAMRNE